jgi:transposase-like protein
MKQAQKRRSVAQDALTHLSRAADYVRLLRRQNAELRAENAALQIQLAVLLAGQTKAVA